MKTINSKDYEYFDTAISFAERYRILLKNYVKIIDIQVIIDNFCHSQNDDEIKELLKQGEPLSSGYIIIQESIGCAPYYHTGTGYTRDKIRARMFSELESNNILNTSKHCHLTKERISI
jgi:hypothetical protein